MTALSEREKQILRMVLAGHDAKSIARALDLSVHTVNERLRAARHKLGAGSSREAARLLAAQESLHPEMPVDKGFGLAPAMAPGAGRWRPSLWGILASTGAIMIASVLIFIAGLHAGAASPQAAPQVVSTFPARGQAVPAGPVTLSVTYDRAMRPGSYSFVQVDPRAYPNCAPAPMLSADRRTYSLACRVEAGRAYELWFNRGRFMNFVGESGVPAVPYRLRFRTR